MWPFRSKRDPDITQQYLQLVDEGRFVEARPLIEEIVAIAPHIPTSWFNLGICLAELANHRQAAEAFLKAYDLDPEDGGALLRACLALAHANDSAGLLRVFRTECERDPDMIELFVEEEAFARFFATPPFQQLRRQYTTSS